MSGTPASKSDERRRSPRAQCRLHGRVVRGRERIRVRVVDVSEGGLCLLYIGLIAFGLDFCQQLSFMNKVSFFYI